jgi:hypothetical protein
MSIKRTMIYTVIVLLLGSGAYTAYHVYVNFTSRSAHFLGVKSTQLDREKIGDLFLYQSIMDLKPAPLPDTNNALFDYYTWENGTKIATNKKNDKIIRIINYAGDVPTAKGVKTGDTKEKVIQSYGKEHYERFEQGSNIIGYVDKKLNRTLEFWFSQGKVDAIRLDIGSME